MEIVVTYSHRGHLIDAPDFSLKPSFELWAYFTEDFRRNALAFDAVLLKRLLKCTPAVKLDKGLLDRLFLTVPAASAKEAIETECRSDDSDTPV